MRKHVEALDRQIDEALELVRPGTKRELGGQLMLDTASLHKYHALRDTLFEHVRAIDGMVEDQCPVPDGDLDAPVKSTKLPREFVDQFKLVERKLQQSRTASLADEALIEVKGAVAVMKRILDYVHSGNAS